MKNAPIPIITENIFLEGVLQTFGYQNGRIYDSGIFDKAEKLIKSQPLHEGQTRGNSKITKHSTTQAAPPPAPKQKALKRFILKENRKRKLKKILKEI
jgi:hypothetical protein